MQAPTFLSPVRCPRTLTNGTWNFTIVVSDMGGVNRWDVVSYYVVAQDVVSPTPNIGSNPAGVTTGTVNSHTAPDHQTLIRSHYTFRLYSVGTGSLGGEADILLRLLLLLLRTIHLVSGCGHLWSYRCTYTTPVKQYLSVSFSTHRQVWLIR
jgi:hypothetical protein